MTVKDEAIEGLLEANDLRSKMSILEKDVHNFKTSTAVEKLQLLGFEGGVN